MCHAARRLGCLVVAKCKWGKLLRGDKTRKNTGNGNDFVYGPAGISKANVRDPFNVTHMCRQDESVLTEAGER
ncbi:hypothetical protein ABG768_017575, partial [Culter alburnus]